VAEPPLRILLTNRVLANRTGTELFVRDVALGLLRRGHFPVVYSPRLGPLADEVRALTIPVVDDLARLAEPPQVIHGHHGLETLTALLAFPGVPAVSVCHSWIGWADEPVLFPRIRRYLAVDETCRHRLVAEHGIDPARVEVVLNAVDLQRFKPRPPLPARPRKALVFSNNAGEKATHVQAIRAACAQAGITVEVAGSKSGKTLDRPELVLGEFDLVFAKARAALEAAAVGAAVVLCDVAGCGPMLTSENLAGLRRQNFGMRALREAPTAEGMAREIGRYDPADAAEVSRQVRALAGSEMQLDQLLATYREAISDPGAADPEAELRAAAAYLRRLSPKLFERELLHAAFARLLRLPGVGGWMRRLAAREHGGSWLQQLLRAMEGD
jgi:hypothetical protein